jgi:glutathione-independent formaldehyde dehydrogenase
MEYNRQLVMAILHDQGADRQEGQRHHDPARRGPECYQAFDQGAAKEYILDPHCTVA